jgi:hypothetical protein
MTLAFPSDLSGNAFYKHILNRVHRNNGNFNIVVDGLPRSGKSRACLRMGFDLDRDSDWKRRFDPRNICFSFQDVISRINDIPDSQVGRVVIWEEAGSYTGANSRTWQSKFNMEASKLFQTVGYRRLILIVNLPHYYMLDKQVRMLVHAKITMDRVQGNLNRSKGTLDMVSPHRSEYDIFKSPGITLGSKNNELYRIIYFSSPPKTIDNYYVKLESEFKTKWIKESQEKLSETPIKKEPSISLENRILDLLEANGQNGLKIMDVYEIEAVKKLNPTYDTISRALRRYKAKNKVDVVPAFR